MYRQVGNDLSFVGPEAIYAANIFLADIRCFVKIMVFIQRWMHQYFGIGSDISEKS